MIKISKDIHNVPHSLNPTSGTIGRNTHQKRLEIIAANAYIDNDRYNSRYKYDDTKKYLKKIYRGKCAFCESKEGQLHVEHYRPKQIYYWLAFSWDNLLFACTICNQNKSTKFEIIAHTRATYTTSYLVNCNNFSAYYDRIENPKLLNPEITDPSKIFKFNINGMITSEDIRGIYTIETCGLDRDDLNDNRKKILDDFKKDITVAFANYFSSKQKLKVAIQQTLNAYNNRLNNIGETYLAFRRYSKENGTLNDIINEVIFLKFQ